MTALTRTNDRLARALLLTEGPAMTEEPQSPTTDTVEYALMWRHRSMGMAVGYVYARRDAGDCRVSDSPAALRTFATWFVVSGKDPTQLKALYEQFAAEQATPPSDPKGGQR